MSSKYLVLLIIILTIPLVYGHLPPLHQIQITSVEVENSIVTFMVFPKNPAPGEKTEIIIEIKNNGEPYIGQVVVGVEGIGEEVAIPFDDGYYEINALFPTEGTYNIYTKFSGLEATQTVEVASSGPSRFVLGSLGILTIAIFATFIIVYLERERG